jgi:hypothetical protein
MIALDWQRVGSCNLWRRIPRTGNNTARVFGHNSRGWDNRALSWRPFIQQAICQDIAPRAHRPHRVPATSAPKRSIATPRNPSPPDHYSARFLPPLAMTFEEERAGARTQPPITKPNLRGDGSNNTPLPPFPPVHCPPANSKPKSHKPVLVLLRASRTPRPKSMQHKE